MMEVNEIVKLEREISMVKRQIKRLQERLARLENKLKNIGRPQGAAPTVVK